jgi:exportin-1
MTTSKVQELKSMMVKEFGAVFELCCFIFENSQNVKQSLLIEAIKLYSSYVKWFPLEFVFREDILSKFLNDFKQMTFLRVEVMKCLGEICKYINLKLYF